MKRLFLFLFAALVTSQMWGSVTLKLRAYEEGTTTLVTGTPLMSTYSQSSKTTYDQYPMFINATDKKNTYDATTRNSGDRVQVTACELEGYTFKQWKLSDNIATKTINKNVVQFIMPNGTASVIAEYSKGASSSDDDTETQGSDDSESTLNAQNDTVDFLGTNSGKLINYALPADVVDMGKAGYWRTKNVGATSETDRGYYYLWGSTTANSKAKSYTYPASYSDPVPAACGTGYFTPTKDELEKLISTSNTTWTADGNNYKIKSSATGNTIILPATGTWDETRTTPGISNSIMGAYWSSTMATPTSNGAMMLKFNASKSQRYVTYVKSSSVATLQLYLSMFIRPVYRMSGTLYTLTVNVKTPTNTYVYKYKGASGQVIKIDVTPQTGYSSAWNDGISTSSARKFTLTADIERTITFTATSTTAINVSANPADAAKSVTATAVANGSSTLTAVANEGYEFVNWTEGTTVLGTSASYTYNNITESHNVVANFAKVEAISRTVENNGVNKNFTSSSVPENAVDLGLSVMWADRNLGATSSDGEFSSQGLRYAWGETKARKGNLQEMFDADHYQFAANNPEKLATANDAAYQADHSWRMPTKAEFEELINKCTWTYKSTTPKGWVVSRNGNSMFLPFDGYYEGSNSLVSTAACFYWTNELKEGTGAGKKPYFFAASSSLKAVGNGALIGGNYKINAYAGLCIRPVTESAPAAQAYTLTIKAIYCGVTSTNTYICNAGQVIRIKPDAAGVTWYNSNNVVCNEGNDNLDVTMNSNQMFTAVFDNSTIAVEEDQVIHEDDTENGAVKDLTSGEDTPETEIPAEAVDLGLSVMWAEVNVGVTKDNVKGGFYAWAETNQKQSYTWDNYTFSNGNTDKVTKYAIKGGYGGLKDNKTALEDADDAAIVGLQGAWRMPTKAEWKELTDQCTWTWKVKDHNWGYEVEGPTGKSIFLPAAGMKSSTTTMLEGKRGYYWSSNLGSGESKYASCMKFSDADYLLSTDTRYCGMSIRPVCPAPAAKCTLTIVINGGTKKNTYVGYPGQTVTIKAEAKTTANFLRWNDGNTENPRIFTLRGDAQYTAFFDDENATDLYEGSDNGNWEESSNWRNEGKPTATTNVTLDQPIQVGPATPNPETPVQAIAQNLTLQEGGDLKVNDGATLTITEDLNIEAGASVTIAPGAVVRVEGTITSDQANAIVIQSDENGVGSLIVSTSEEVHPYGSVQLYTVAKKINEENYQWQHFGIPTMEKPTITKSQDVGTYYYSWDTDEGWVNKIGSAALTAPFVGHNLTNLSTDGGVVYTFSGQLVGNQVDSMKFVTDGWALLANSYTVPVSIKAILEALPDGMERTIQVYNPIYGENKANYMQSVTLGQINKGVAKFTELLPMQAFFVLANGESGSSLNYRSAAVMPSSAPQEAPRRATNAISAQLTIKISDNNGGEDGLDLYEEEGATATEKNDLDATKQMSGTPLIYAKKGGTELNSYASGNLVGTVIGLSASNATNYTLTVKGQSGTIYSLYDNVAKATVLLNNETEYHFSADAKSVNAARFVIRNVSTDCDEITMQHTPIKVISDQQVVIIRDGERYSILGTRL